MERFDVRLLQKEHNRMCILKGAAFVLAAAAAWPFAYGFAYYVPRLVGHTYRLDWLVSLGHPIAIGFVTVLALEGFRHRNPAPIAEDYISRAPMGKHRTVGDYHLRGFGLEVVMLSHLLFAAPRSTLGAIRSFRLLISMTETEVRMAERVVKALAERREWQPASKLDPGLLVVGKLDALGVVWLKEDIEGLRVVLSPRTILRFFPETPIHS